MEPDELDEYYEYLGSEYDGTEEVTDNKEAEAINSIREFINENKERVFYIRQLEIEFEKKFFHWITGRAIRRLETEGLIASEWRELDKLGIRIKLVWHKSYRFNKKAINGVCNLVERFSDPRITAGIGWQGEMLIIEGFTRNGFEMVGRSINEYEGKKWTKTNHDLDFIFRYKGVGYGVEVKNTLGYMPEDEFKVKLEMCETLGIRSIFACRMLPATWINELRKAGGFGLIMKYQFYPISETELVAEIRNELGLPVDSPKRLEQGTMDRLLKYYSLK